MPIRRWSWRRTACASSVTNVARAPDVAREVRQDTLMMDKTGVWCAIGRRTSVHSTFQERVLVAEPEQRDINNLIRTNQSAITRELEHYLGKHLSVSARFCPNLSIIWGELHIAHAHSGCPLLLLTRVHISFIHRIKLSSLGVLRYLDTHFRCHTYLNIGKPNPSFQPDDAKKANHGL